jgi:hypothetical protein
VRVAYDVLGADPFTKHSPLDFDLTGKEIEVDSTILPAAFRIVLLYLAHNPSEEDDGWKADWKRFCNEGLGLDTDPDDLDDDDDDGRVTWVDDAVRRYCETKGFVEKARLMLPGQSNG